MKKQIMIIGSIVVVIVGFFLFSSRNNQTQLTGGQIFETTVNETTNPTTVDEGYPVEVDENIEENYLPHSGTIFVDVQGEVVSPGVFEVQGDVRVGHLIELAGGLTPDANTRGLNQASRIYDEMIIFVPHIDDIVIINEASPETPTGTSNQGATDDHLISLSNASALELQELPGIGPALSGNIIAHREANGAFSSVDDLINVPGVGARILENIRELVKP